MPLAERIWWERVRRGRSGHDREAADAARAYLRALANDDGDGSWSPSAEVVGRAKAEYIHELGRMTGVGPPPPC